MVTQANFAASRSGFEHTTQNLLTTLGAAGGKPLEQLSPREARGVLVDLQASPKLTLPSADVSEKTIKAHNKTINLTIVRPTGVSGTPPCLHVLPWRWGVGSGRLPNS